MPTPEFNQAQAAEARPAAASAYHPIEDYALIGDCHGCALVARDGRIDWAALHRFNADPVFCRVLDDRIGGFWSIRPAGAFESERTYLPDTNILRTVFKTPAGSFAVTDFMPVGRTLGASVHDYVHLNAPGWIVRRIEALADLRGDITLAIGYRPSKSFAADEVSLCIDGEALRAGAEMPTLYSRLAFDIEGDTAHASLKLKPGQTHDLVLADNMVEGESPLARVDEFFAATKAFWEEWIGYCRYHGPYEREVRRSALALKLMTYAPSGAIVAAATTSLPEQLGGGRNWDYRFCWVRDSSFALYALSVLGYSGEAQCFHDYLLRACVRSLPRVRPLYGIDGALKLDENTLDHLEGYEQSAPVHSGNGAYLQAQIDVYGQVLDLAQLYKAMGGKLHTQYLRLLDAVAKYIAAHWQDPDQGIWEMRGPPRHHVHGKLMSWAGMDRAARLLGSQTYRRLAEEIASQILDHSRAPELGHLPQAWDGGVDAAVLLAPMLGFALPPEMLGKTIDTVIDALGQGEFIARYSGEDGLDGGEGAFLVCSSWLADAELAAGRVDVARKRIEDLLARANDVGLYAEEVDVESGRFLGNFPQALTHLGLIGNIVNLQLAERRGADALQGSYADRAQRAVHASFGWRGVLAAMWQSRMVGRIFSSKKSKLAWP